MKKELAITGIIFIIAVLGFSIVSAGWFSDMTSSFSMTGKVISFKTLVKNIFINKKEVSPNNFQTILDSSTCTLSGDLQVGPAYCDSGYYGGYSDCWTSYDPGGDSSLIVMPRCEQYENGGSYCVWYAPGGTGSDGPYNVFPCPDGQQCINHANGARCGTISQLGCTANTITNCTSNPAKPICDLSGLPSITYQQCVPCYQFSDGDTKCKEKYNNDISHSKCDNIQGSSTYGQCIAPPLDKCTDQNVGNLKAENICTPSSDGDSASFICSDDKKKANQTYCADTKNCANKPSQTCPTDAPVCDEDQKKCVAVHDTACYGRLDPQTPISTCPPKLGEIDFNKKGGSYEDFAYDSITNSAEDCKYKSIEQKGKIIYYQEIAGGKCQLTQGVPTCVVDPSNKKCTAYKAYSAKFNPITIPNVLESEFATKTAEELVKEAYFVNEGLKIKEKADYPDGWCQEGNNECEARDYVKTVPSKVSITSNAVAHPEYRCSGKKHIGTIKKGFYLQLVVDLVKGSCYGIPTLDIEKTLIASAVATVSSVYEKIINDAIQDKNNFVCNNDPQKLCDKEIKNLNINAEINYGGSFKTSNPFLYPLKAVLSFGGLYVEVAYSYDIVCVKKEKTPTSTYTVKVEARGATGKTDCFDKDNIPDESKYGTIVDLTNEKNALQKLISLENPFSP